MATRTGPNDALHGRHPGLAEHRQAHAARLRASDRRAGCKSVGDQLGQRASAGRFERRHPVELNRCARLGAGSRSRGRRRRRSGWRQWPGPRRRARRATSPSRRAGAVRATSVLVRALSPPNWPTTMRHWATDPKPGAQAARARGRRRPRGRHRSASSSRSRSAPCRARTRRRAPCRSSTGSPPAPAPCVGPRMPSTRPQSKPSRPSRDCSSATSSPRRFGEVRNSSRSPSFQLASTRAVQVCSSQRPSQRRPRPVWKARTAASVAATESRRLGAGGGWKPGGTEAALQIADGLAALTGCQREVGRNSLSS